MTPQNAVVKLQHRTAVEWPWRRLRRDLLDNQTSSCGSLNPRVWVTINLSLNVRVFPSFLIGIIFSHVVYSLLCLCSGGIKAVSWVFFLVSLYSEEIGWPLEKCVHWRHPKFMVVRSTAGNSPKPRPPSFPSVSL